MERASRQYMKRTRTAVVEVLGGEAGMHLAVALSDSSRDVEIAERAAGQNLWIWRLSRSYMGEMSRSGFILGFGSATVAEIPRAVRKLREMRPTCSPFSIFTRVLKFGESMGCSAGRETGVWRCRLSKSERAMPCRMPTAGSATSNCATPRNSRPEALPFIGAD